MNIEEARAAYKILNENFEVVNKDLAEINNSRIYMDSPFKLSSVEEEMDDVIKSLVIITNPQAIIAARNGEYYQAKPNKTHAHLLEDWKAERERQGLPELKTLFVGSIISGYSFGLRNNPGPKYVSLDIDSREWTAIHPATERLVDDGFVVVDAFYHRVARDMDYSLFWTERNDS